MRFKRKYIQKDFGDKKNGNVCSANERQKFVTGKPLFNIGIIY